MKTIIFLLAAVGLHAQTLSVDKPSLAFSAQYGGAAVSQTLNTTSSSGTLNFVAFTNNTSWLTVTPSSGTAPTALTVTANPNGLLPATYQGTLSLFATNRVDIQVTLTVGAVAVSPPAVTFAYQIGANVPQSTSVTLTSSQPTTVSLTTNTTNGGNWLQVTPATGTSPGTATLSVNPNVLTTLGTGTYTGTLTVTPTSGTSTAPATVAVTLTVSPAPPVTVTPAGITLAYQLAGTNNNAQQSLTLATTGSQGVAYGVSSTVDPNPSGRVWFTITPTGGTIPANGNAALTVAYDTSANLPAGTYTGKITVGTPGGNPSQTIVPVTLLVSTAPLLNVANGALTFNYQVGTAAPAAQNVTVTSTGGALPLAISAITANNSGNWLTVPATGTTGTAFPVSVNPAGLSPGTYNGSVSVAATGAGNGPLQIAVTLTVANNPVIVAIANGCNTAVNGSCPFTFADQINQTGPAAQNLKLTSSTGAALNYTITAQTPSCGGAWLLPGGALTNSGTTDATIPISANAAGIAAGSTCNATLSVAATIASTGAAAPNSPMTIPVTLYVSNSALLVVNQSALTFNSGVSGQSPPIQTVTLTSTSATDQLNYTVTFNTTSGGNNWLFVTPLSGTTAAGANGLNVAVFPGLLSAGVYSGTITITATGPGGAAVADSPVVIPITFQVTSGNMSVSQSALTFTQTTGGAAPAAQAVNVTSSGQALNYSVSAAVNTTSNSVNWLTATPATGTTPGSVSISVDGSKLPPGTYSGTVTVSSTTASTGGSPAAIQITLNVTAGTISATPTTLTFTQAVNGTAPASQTVTIAGAPAGIPITIQTSTANSSGNWLSATPTSGNAPGTITVTANAGSLPLGQYTGSVTITAPSPGATGSPITIPVTLNVVTGQILTVTPTTLSFAFALGGTTPVTQTVQVTASGNPVPFTAVAAASGGGTWLSVSPASGNTPGTLTVSVNPQSLTASATPYTGTITISSPNAVSTVPVTVSLVVSSIPKPQVNAIGNAASYFTGGVSPGENIVIFGTGIGPAALAKGTLNAGGSFDVTAGNTQVTFDGTPAPVIYASATQTSVMVPYGVFGRQVTTIRVSYQGVISDPLIYNVSLASPGIYTLNQSGSGPGAILNQDFSVNGPGNPAAKNTTIAVYMTGEGETNVVPADGSIAPVNGNGLYKPLQSIVASIGGVPATVAYAGSAPGIVYGVMQVNLVIPSTVASGPQPVVITLGNATTQGGVTVAVQ